MITYFQNAGIETREQIASLIKDVKKELLKERYQ
jgi:ribosomal protein L29